VTQLVAAPQTLGSAGSVSAAFDSFRGLRTFGSLDGLRCLSILAVIWSHAGRAYEGPLASLLTRGGFGVDLFFIISGFLITTLMLREREANGFVSLRRFYMRRALRIFPLYFAVLGLYIAMIAIAHRGRSEDAAFWSNLPYFATYTYNIKDPFFLHHGIFGHSWSLATEEQFYLLWPLLFVLAPRWAQVGVLACVIGLDIAYSFPSQMIPLEQQPLSTRILAALSSPICLGVLLALTLHGRRGFAVLWRVLGWRWAGPVFLVGLLAALAAWRQVGFLYSTPLAWIAAVGLVGSCVIREDNAMAVVLRWKPAAWIGLVSYGLYLLHPLALGIAQRMLMKLGLDGSMGVALFVGTVLVASVIAGASYYIFERPFLRLKERFASRAATRSEASSAPDPSRSLAWSAIEQKGPFQSAGRPSVRGGPNADAPAPVDAADAR